MEEEVRDTAVEKDTRQKYVKPTILEESDFSTYTMKCFKTPIQCNEAGPRSS